MNRASDGDATKEVRSALTLSLTRMWRCTALSPDGSWVLQTVSDKFNYFWQTENAFSSVCTVLHPSCGRSQSSILTSHPLAGILWTEVLGLKSRFLAPVGSVLSGLDISDARRCLGTSLVNETSVPVKIMLSKEVFSQQSRCSLHAIWHLITPPKQRRLMWSCNSTWVKRSRLLQSPELW